MGVEFKVGDVVNASPEKNFTIMSNDILSIQITHKAIGVLFRLISRPDGWKNYVSEIVSSSSDGTSAINSALKELEGNGYLIRIKYKDKLTKRWAGSFWACSDMPNNFDLRHQKKKLKKSGFIIDKSKLKYVKTKNRKTTSGKTTDRKTTSGLSTSGKPMSRKPMTRKTTPWKSATNKIEDTNKEINKKNDNDNEPPSSSFLNINFSFQLSEKQQSELSDLVDEHGPDFIDRQIKYTNLAKQPTFAFFIRSCAGDWAQSLEQKQAAHSPTRDMPTHVRYNTGARDEEVLKVQPDGTVILPDGYHMTLDQTKTQIETGALKPCQPKRGIPNPKLHIHNDAKEFMKELIGQTSKSL